MKLRPLSFGLVSAFAVLAHAAPEVVSGSLLVKPKAGQSAAVHSAYKAMGATVTRTLPQIGWEAIRLGSGMTVQAAMTRLSGEKAVADVEPNFVSHPTDLPNDPMVPAQYALVRMKLSQAWSVVLGTNQGTPGTRDAIVAIVDTGVDVNHPDLKDACIAGWDTAGNDSNVMGTNPHGTHCAGIAAATGNNGIGIAGVAYGAAVMPVKVFPDGVDGASDDAFAAGVIWAADHGANVISMSLGYEGQISDLMANALDYAYAKNVVLVAAAGNNGNSNQFSPAYYSKCIAVGATDSVDAKAGFSNYGADWVDVAAPGVGIRSTVFDGQYADYSGTSMACPNTAGVATLIVSLAGPGTLTNDEIRALIEDNCDPISDPNLGSWVARGRVNAFRAVSAVPLPVVDAAPPTLPTPIDGSLTNASLDVLDATDGVSATLKSARKPGVGYSGSMTAAFAMTKLNASDLRNAEISFTMQTDRLATVQVYLQNANTKKWVLAFAKPGTGASQTIDQKMTKAAIAPYLTSTGTVNAMVRSLVPMAFVGQSQGITKIDQLQITFSGRRNAGSAP